MIPLWCLTFSNHGWLYHAWNTTSYNYYLLFLRFRGYCRTLGIYTVLYLRRTAISSSFHVKLQGAFFLLVCIEHAFYYASCPLIDLAPWNDATSLTACTTHSRLSDTNILHVYIYMYTLNPMESNYRDGINC